MNQPTSADSYRVENENAGLTTRRQVVLDYIRQHPDCTQNEADRDLSHGPSRAHGGRFSELIEMGMIKESGTKLDPLTGKNNLTYRVTERVVPLPLQKEARAKANAALLDQFVEVVVAEERFRVQEMEEPGIQQPAMIRRKKELRQQILRRMNRREDRPNAPGEGDQPPAGHFPTLMDHLLEEI